MDPGQTSMTVVNVSLYFILRMFIFYVVRDYC